MLISMRYEENIDRATLAEELPAIRDDELYEHIVDTVPLAPARARLNRDQAKVLLKEILDNLGGRLGKLPNSAIRQMLKVLNEAAAEE